jgi:hypothetical protein
MAAFLHWTSHYLQSPLAAVAGYLDLLSDTSFRSRQDELRRSAQAAASRAQQVLGSVVVLHKQLERSDGVGNGETAHIDTLLTRAVEVSGLRMSTIRQRTLPLACIEGETAFDGLCLFLGALATELGAARVTVNYRQKADALVVHLGFAKRSAVVDDILYGLSSLPPERYPLIDGRYSALAVGVVLLRAAGLDMVVRPRGPRRSDIYLHARLLRQLSLVDPSSDLG